MSYLNHSVGETPKVRDIVATYADTVVTVIPDPSMAI
jgi:hypothetical protein